MTAPLLNENSKKREKMDGINDNNKIQENLITSGNNEETEEISEASSTEASKCHFAEKIRTGLNNLKMKIANCDKVRVLSASIALCAAVAAVAAIFIADSFSISVVFFAVAVVASLVYVADCAKDSIKKGFTSVRDWFHNKFAKPAEVKQEEVNEQVTVENNEQKPEEEKVEIVAQQEEKPTEEQTK